VVTDIPLFEIEDVFKTRFFHNTYDFRESAKTFIKHGKYCLAPKKSMEWYQFWERETDRCLNGMYSSGMYVTGKHYFYLNYCPIQAVPDGLHLEIYPDLAKNRKILTFAKFWELDYQWFLTKLMCEQRAASGSRLDCHLVCLKTRRAGYSFKEACEGVYNYTFAKGSKSLYYAGTDQYLTEGGIFNKVDAMLAHVNGHTFWKQNFLTNTQHYKVSGYKEKKTKKPLGNKSQLQAVVLNKANKARGDDALKVTFEEFGSFDEGLRAWEICLPQVRAGKITTGLMTGFGTGGDVEGLVKTKDGMEAIETIFYNPAAYLAVAFPNIWDEGLEGTECGFFVPAFMTYDSFADKDGNLNKRDALNFVLDERKIREKGKNIDHVKAESPLEPKEALHRGGFDEFPRSLIISQKNFLNTDTLVANTTRVCKFDKTGMNLVPSTISPYNEYPVPLDGNEKKSSIVMWQDRFLIENSVPGEIGDVYIAVLDPVMKDEAPTSKSIFACYIYKRTTDYDKRQGDRIVVAYNARYKTRAVYYKELFQLIRYYNAKLYCEAGGGGDAVLDYGRTNGFEDYLAYELTFDNRKEMDITRNRSYFINMPTTRKNSAITFLAEWLVRERGLIADNPLAKDGVLLNIHLFFCIGGLTELEKYNDTDNFDRVSALLILALVIQEIEKEQKEKEETKREKNKSNFFNRSIYKKQRNSHIKNTYLSDI